MQTLSSEQTLFDEPGVQITTARFVVGHQTYPIQAITYVAPFTVPVDRGAPLALAALSLLPAIGGAASLLWEPSIMAFVIMAAGIGASALGALWWRSRKDVHGLTIATSGMQVKALVTPDAALVSRVTHALNAAIASR